MADFVAILSKTIDGLGERNTADMRQRVYDRARKAIADKLAAITPPPSKTQADRQYKLLDDAIDEIERRYAPKPAVMAAGDPLADFLATVDNELKAPVAVAPEPKSASPFGESPLPPFPRSAGVNAPAPVTVTNGNAAAKPMTAPEVSIAAQHDPVLGLDQTGEMDAPKATYAPRNAEKSGGGIKGLLFGLAGLLLIGGAGYAGYLYKDKISALMSGSSTTNPEKVEPAPVKAEPETKPVDPQVAVTPPEQPAQQPATATTPKLTQRLTPEGQEVDAGPGTTPSDVGEGTSTASATTPSTPAPPAPSGETPATQQVVAIGQKAIFYEEKTGTEQGTADQGNVVWSVVQDSPGLDQPPEPAIRGDISIPEKGIGMRMTIKRNVDKSLPASHIIEMLFTTPEGFAGGAVENVSRFSMKETEQAPGNPMVGVPAAFGDGFFLIALTDEKTAIDTNIQLLEKQSWVDIPVAYRTGRRALLSFEKGLSGDKVFKEVIDAWKAKQGG